MSMSRKHYVEAAEIIKFEVRMAEGMTPVRRKVAMDAVRGVADGFANMFGRENFRFDRARFMDACGLGDPNGN